jgi:hypothetical protein
MAELSQKTLGGVIKLLSELPPNEAATFPLVQDFWRQKLFEWGLPNWFIRYGADKRFNWTIIVPDMFSGFPKFSGTQDIVPETLRNTCLLRLTAIALKETRNQRQGDELRLSLQSDGFKIPKPDVQTVNSQASGSRGYQESKSPLEIKSAEPDNRISKSPLAFISYSWDSEVHKKWVLDLATKLQAEGGVQIILDRWDLRPGEDRTIFMEKSVTNSDFVILICTPDYARKANSRRGGVGYEATIITGELAENINPGKFIPILRHGEWDSSSLPVWIKTKLGVDLRDNPYSGEQYQELLRALHKEPLKAPPIGPKPQFENSPPVDQEVVPPEWAVRTMQFDEDLTPYDREAVRRKLAVVRIDAWHPRLTVWLTNRSDHSILVRSVSLWHSNGGRNHKRLNHGVPSDNRVFVELRPRAENAPIAFVTDEDAKLKLQSLGVVEKHLAGYEFSDDVDVEVRVEYDLLGVEDEYHETVRVRVHGNRQIESL